MLIEAGPEGKQKWKSFQLNPTRWLKEDQTVDDEQGPEQRMAKTYMVRYGYIWSIYMVPNLPIQLLKISITFKLFYIYGNTDFTFLPIQNRFPKLCYAIYMYIYIYYQHNPTNPRWFNPTSSAAPGLAVQGAAETSRCRGPPRRSLPLVRVSSTSQYYDYSESYCTTGIDLWYPNDSEGF